MSSVVDAAKAIGLTRLAHFTPSKNLPHIVRDGMIRSSKDLADNAPEYFAPTDRGRFDQHPDKICCSLQFPNGYYLAVARTKEQFSNYPDWVCLLLDIALLSRPGTLFSPCNAAKGSGAYLRGGADALAACYAEQSEPGGFRRGRVHHRLAPTDLQTEALIPGPIALSHLRAIVVPSESLAENELNRLRLLGLDPAPLRWVLAPLFFERDRLASRLRFGGEIEETPWTEEQR
jgi:hypothetical protein